MKFDMNREWRWLALFLLLVLAWAAYSPGLSGGFLFDDYVNLDALGNDGRVDNWATFWRYITSGTADPGGRPLSLLSFLLDARDWPADPTPFLRTNLLLHLINGALLFSLLRQLGRVLGNNTDARIDAAALVGAGLWLVHPLFVSTVFYVVQRQAMLPATFTLLALIAYTKGREQFVESDGRQGLVWMLGGVVAGTALAMLCKLNGVLVPVLCLVLECTVFLRQPANGESVAKKMRRIRMVLLILPSLAVLAYLSSFAGHLNDPLGNRPWTLGQRLITEPRVLVDYLELLVVPRSVTSGLFNDSYVASTSLLHPMSTLFASLLILALLIAAIRIRHKFPDISLALLFYFAGHLLESTVIPLELYFEHRNYLPAMLLFWPVARALFRLPARMSVHGVIAVAILGTFALTSYQRAVIWGQPAILAKLWASQSPDSSRAQAAAAISDLNAGRVQAALRRLAPLWNENPYDLQIAFNFINARCAAKGPSDVEKKALATALRRTPKSELLTHNWLERAIVIASAGDCPGLTLDDVDTWIQSALANPIISSPSIRNQDIEPLLALLALERKQPQLALLHFNRSLTALPSPDVAARQASALASYGAYREALAHLDVYEANKARIRRPGAGMAWLHAKVLESQGYWPREMRILRENLREALQGQGNTAP